MIAHYKWTQWWLEKSRADRTLRDKTYERLHNQYADPALSVMMHLKGLYCKVGQVMSSRPDFLPSQYVIRFATVQDAIPQWPVESIKELVEESLQTSFGCGYDDVFESMDSVALGSASIGQVHRAVLREPWSKHHKEVAVKVMHPDAQGRFAHDFQVFRWVCRLALPAWRGMLDELEKRFMTEFDYLREAGSMTTVRSNLENSRFRRKVYIPKPVTELCTSNVLVMEMLEGKKLVDAMRDRLAQSMGGNLELASVFLESQRNKVLLVDNAEFSSTSSDLIDTLSLFQKIRLLLLRRRCRQYVDTLIAVHGHQILHDGFFNGDPHPGA
jgi:aarF domain-containing kinase